MRQREARLLPPSHEVVTDSHENSQIEARVRQRVAELLTAKDEFIWEPFYRIRRIANEMMRLQTVAERRKWQVFYARYGCMRCHTDERPHMGNGCCSDCYKWVRGTLKAIIREESAGRNQ